MTLANLQLFVRAKTKAILIWWMRAKHRSLRAKNVRMSFKITWICRFKKRTFPRTVLPKFATKSREWFRSNLHNWETDLRGNRSVFLLVDFVIIDGIWLVHFDPSQGHKMNIAIDRAIIRYKFDSCKEVKGSFWSSSCLVAVKAKPRGQNPKAVLLVRGFNFQSVESTVFFARETTLSVSAPVHPSTSLLSWSTCPLKSWNWRAMLLETTRNQESFHAIFNWQFATTKNWTSFSLVSRSLKEAFFRTSRLFSFQRRPTRKDPRRLPRVKNIRD